MVPVAKRAHTEGEPSTVEVGDGHEAHDKAVADTCRPDGAPDVPETSACESQDQATTSADLPVADGVVESGLSAVLGPDGGADVADGTLDVKKEAQLVVDDSDKQSEAVWSGYCSFGCGTLLFYRSMLIVVTILC